MAVSASVVAYIVLTIFGLAIISVVIMCLTKKVRRSTTDPQTKRIDNTVSVPSLLRGYAMNSAAVNHRAPHRVHNLPDSSLPMVSVASDRQLQSVHDFNTVPMVVRMTEVLTVDHLAGRFDHKIHCPILLPEIPDLPVYVSVIENFISDMGREKPVRFTPQQLEGYTLNYAWQLGSGGFGIVYKGEFPNGVKIAVKVLNNSAGEGVKEQFMAEVSTIGRTYHKNLVRLYGFCFDAMLKALVYEYMENGSLDTILFNKKHTIEWEKLYNIAIGTAKGLAYLHEDCQKRIIHYDIKPGNILLDFQFSPKVADFGLAKICNKDSSHVTMIGARGTPGYAAPELWMPYSVTYKCDVYSYGMMLFEIVGRRRNLDLNLAESHQWFPKQAWEKFEKEELDEMLLDCGIEEKNRDKAKTMLMVALWCVQYSSEARPSMSNVVKVLEGGAQVVMVPPNPFQHLASSSSLGLTMFVDTDGGDESKIASDRISQVTTPSMEKYEINIATF